MKVAVCALTLVASASAFSSTPRTQSVSYVIVLKRYQGSAVGRNWLVEDTLIIGPAVRLRK